MQTKERIAELATGLKPHVDQRENVKLEIKRLETELNEVENKKVIFQRKKDEIMNQVSVAIGSGNTKAAMDLRRKARDISVDILDSQEMAAFLKDKSIPEAKGKLQDAERELEAAIKSRLPGIREQATKELDGLLNAAFDFSNSYDVILKGFFSDMEISSSDMELTAGSLKTVLVPKSPGLATACRVLTFA